MANATHQLDAKVDEKGNLSLKAVPFPPGETVHVILIGHDGKNGKGTFQLRGKPIKFVDPTRPAAQDDWSAPK